MMGNLRRNSQRPFGQSLDFEKLPVLGRDTRRAERARAWRRLGFALGAFWAAVATAILIASGVLK
jgi:hypothetical protein